MSTEIKLTNEQVARIFAMYYNCEVFWHPPLSTNPSEWKLFDSDYWQDALNHVKTDREFLRYKLALTPLSAISDEDAIEVAKIFWVDVTGMTNVAEGVSIVRRYFIEGNTSTIGSVFSKISTYQYLIQQGYAVPIFIAPNHPDNGKTAIELGLAIDKTTQP